MKKETTATTATTGKKMVSSIRGIPAKELRLCPKSSILAKHKEKGYAYRWEVPDYLFARTEVDGWEIVKDKAGKEIIFGSPDSPKREILLKKPVEQYQAEYKDRQQFFEEMPIQSAEE